MIRAPSNWTPERLAQLRTLIDEGLSANEIAKRLGGTTRNAVIGKRHRLRIATGRPTPVAPTKPRAPRKPRTTTVTLPTVATPTPSIPLSIVTVAAPTGLQIWQLENHHCRWPIGDPVREPHAFHMCGLTRADPSLPVERSPYCEAHAAGAYNFQAKEPKKTNRTWK